MNVHGLDDDSFVLNSGTNLSVRRGTTTKVRATDDLLEDDEEAQTDAVVYSKVTTPPKKRYVPVLEVPLEIQRLELQGRIEVELTISADGHVTAVSVVQGLHPAADAACVDVMYRSRWKAGTSGGKAVIVSGVPYSCRIEMLD